jgi:hypothetical protein
MRVGPVEVAILEAPVIEKILTHLGLAALAAISFAGWCRRGPCRHRAAVRFINGEAM